MRFHLVRRVRDCVWRFVIPGLTKSVAHDRTWLEKNNQKDYRNDRFVFASFVTVKQQVSTFLDLFFFLFFVFDKQLLAEI